MTNPTIETTGTTKAADLEAAIQEIVNDVAQMDVDREQSFFDLGLDSVMLMDIYNRIIEEFGDVMDLFRLFEHPTIAECAAIIGEQPSS